MGRWELQTWPNPQGWQYHPQHQRDGLFDHLLLLSVFRCQAFTCHTVSLAPRPVALFWGPGSLKAPPNIHPKLLRAPLVLYSPVHHVHLHLANHGARHRMAHPGPGRGAVTRTREEETQVRWDLCLCAIHLTHTCHIRVSSPLKYFATPQTHASTFFSYFNLDNLQRHLTTPGRRWCTSPNFGWGDIPFLFKKPVAAEHHSRPGVQVSASRWAPQTGPLWRHALCDAEN